MQRFAHNKYRRNYVTLFFLSFYADRVLRSKTTLATVCRGFGVDVGTITTPRASTQHTAQRVAAQLNCLVLVDDAELAAACLQEVTAGHSREVPCSRLAHLAVMVFHLL